jgi:membrane-bound serine protease (ClpP class)
MGRKVMNDAVAYIRGLAETRGRNADWAEKAVRDAATLTATEALEQNVIDVIAPNVSELLAAIDGREVSVNNERVALEADGLRIEPLEPTWRIKFLNTITNPQVVLLLLAVGVYGLLFEGYNPGAIYPGVAGAICLLLAAYALQILPVNYVGLALIIVGFVLIIAETLIPSFGALGFGGVIAFIFGAIMMFDSGVPGFGVSKAFVISFAVVMGVLLFWLLSYLVKLRNRGAVSGSDSIVGGTGTAMESFSGEGRIWLEGEAWKAVSNAPLQKDQAVVVRAMDGLTLLVEPLEENVT